MLSRRSCSTYIDDSLVVANRAVMSSVWDNLLRVHKLSNVALSSTPGHLSEPSWKVTALGFEVDLDAGTVSLPEGKLGELVDMARTAL